MCLILGFQIWWIPYFMNRKSACMGFKNPVISPANSLFKFFKCNRFHFHPSPGFFRAFTKFIRPVIQRTPYFMACVPIKENECAKLKDAVVVLPCTALCRACSSSCWALFWLANWRWSSICADEDKENDFLGWCVCLCEQQNKIKRESEWREGNDGNRVWRNWKEEEC